MALAPARRVASLERWSPTLFLVGGGLVLGHAAVRGIEAFTPTAPPPDVFGPLGYLLALVGLLGLYPALVDRTPTVARVAAVVALVPLVGWAAISIATLAGAAGVLGTSLPGLFGGFFLVHMAALFLTYVLFGVASLRAGVHARTVGVLLLVPPVLLVSLMAGAAVIGGSTIGAFVIGSLQAVVHLSIGGLLRAGATPADAPVGDAAAG